MKIHKKPEAVNIKVDGEWYRFIPETDLDRLEDLLLTELRKIPMDRFKVAPLGLATSAISRVFHGGA